MRKNTITWVGNILWGSLFVLAVSGCTATDNDETKAMQDLTNLTAGDAKRVEDLTLLKGALEKYMKQHGQYPKSQGVDGLHSTWGRSGQDWIADLVPDYIDKLPRDPRNSELTEQQYLYISDGTDYKLIAHYPENCELVKANLPQLVDPIRDCWAIGFWTDGAKKR